MLGRFVGFFDEAVQDDDALSEQRAEKRPPNAFMSLGAYFEQPATQRFGVRQPEVCAVLHHAKSDAREAGIDSHRSRQHNLLYVLIEKLNGVFHGHNITYMLYKVKFSNVAEFPLAAQVYRAVRDKLLKCPHL